MTNDRQTMRETNHAPPNADRGTNFSDRRRPATDGGRTNETMADVAHTPPHEALGANRVFERGNEGRR
ncbi:hypothetical protein [Haladaptatus halobius]|uniref:hypothetical protein n=1 Tax=Haladaptatus halobius TaxID=2884875 RepID=UPI001D0B1C71|nr:hypothetical protein [Haladaptatus halobius]